jgi:tRNA 2-thiouridine synthesizing protein D
MNRFLIFVTGSPFDTLNGHTALSFCEAATSLGHRVDQVFFYQQGVQQGNTDVQSGAGEKRLLEQWIAFSEQTKTPLNICVTASIKRGLISEEDAKELHLNSNLHKAFNAVGMAEYFAALSINNDSKDAPPISIQF